MLIHQPAPSTPAISTQAPPKPKPSTSPQVGPHPHSLGFRAGRTPTQWEYTDWHGAHPPLPSQKAVT